MGMKSMIVSTIAPMIIKWGMSELTPERVKEYAAKGADELQELIADGFAKLRAKAAASPNPWDDKLCDFLERIVTTEVGEAADTGHVLDLAEQVCEWLVIASKRSTNTLDDMVAEKLRAVIRAAKY